MANTIPKPFLKWAGGKGQLLDKLESRLPPELKSRGKISFYAEPFVGGGAFYFHLHSKYIIKNSLINDLNIELITTFERLQKNPSALIVRLREISNEFHSLSSEEQKKYYYENLRKPFNQNIITKHSEASEKLETAALTIALNKTCFNGLFRKNSKGEFNVPMGRYTNPRILDEENLKTVSKVLKKNTTILCGDYYDIEKYLKPRSLIYFDPPYRPLSTTSHFTKYAKDDFNDENQRELAQFFRKLHKLGHFVMLSNSNPKNTNADDTFFEDLYNDFNIEEVEARRNINSKSSKRGKITELLITNY
jgi:DNA adenine methylase